MNPEILIIGLVIAFCISATYTDIKSRKIRNLLTYGLIYAGLLYQITLVVLGEFPFYLLLYNVGVSFLVMWLLYWFDVLGPGDAKLFWGISLVLIPAVFGAIISPMPFLILCINIFVPYLFIASVYLILKSTREERREAFLASLRWESLSKVLIFFITFLALGHLLSFLMIEISRRTGFVFGILPHLVMTVLLFQPVRKLIQGQKYSPYLLGAIWSAALATFWFSVMPLYAFGQMLLRLTIVGALYYGLFTGFLVNLQARFSGCFVHIDDLQEGMVPAEQIIKVFSNGGGNAPIQYRKVSGSEINRFDPNAIITPKLSGLSQTEIETLKALKEAGHFRAFNEMLQIQSPVVFAPVLLLGVLLTVLSRGPFYGALLRLFT